MRVLFDECLLRVVVVVAHGSISKIDYNSIDLHSSIKYINNPNRFKRLQHLAHYKNHGIQKGEYVSTKEFVPIFRRGRGIE